MTRARTGRARLPGVAVSLGLLGVLLAVNGVAVWGIVSARESAREEAGKELALQTAVHARTLEATLATLRGDFLLLAQSPPLAKAITNLDSLDPMARRWARLDVESTLLLFLQAHPPVERVVVYGPAGEARVVAGRRQGAPVVLPPEKGNEALVGPEILPGRWGLGGGGDARLDAAVALPGLLRTVAPGLEGRLALMPAGTAVPPAGDALLTARVPVTDAGWRPPVAWTLVRSESESRLVASIETLAGRYRSTVVLNLAVIALTLLLGAFAFRQVRRAARLAAEKEHQLRLRDLERQLMHSERLASVGRLAAGMAHEINNPLEGMANYLSLLSDDLAEGRTDAAPTLLQRLEEGLERVAGITRRVLSFSEPGRTSHEEVDLGEVLAETVELVRGVRAFRACEVTLAAGPRLAVTGSRVTLGQLFLNLMLNACQAQPEGGRVEVTLEPRGERAVVTVDDRGPGLSPDTRDHLFEPFFSTRGSTGLGLAVCRGIAADHDGEIRAADRPGGGARFTVELPLAGATTEPATASDAAAEPAAVGGEVAP